MRVLWDEPMSEHTTLGVGGPVSMFAEPFDMDEAILAMGTFRKLHVPFFVLGNGSNLLVSDEGYEGIVISTFYLRKTEWDDDGHTITCEAGSPLVSLAKRACRHRMSGLEFASGIPGSIGGACAMNAGAFGRCIADVLVSVDVLDRHGEVRTISVDDLGMGYRTSRILKERLVVLRARMQLESGDFDEVRAKMDEYARRRRETQPVGVRSAGSTFKRPEGDFAGRLVEEAGLKGYAVGGACVSERHAGFVVNEGDATASDIKSVIDHVTDEVEGRFGVRLEPEVQFLPSRRHWE